MKQFTQYFSAALLLVFAAAQADNNNNDCGVSPTFVARSQARYKMRENVGVADLTNVYNQDSVYHEFSIIPGYMQSFRPGNIAQALFGNSLVRTSTANASSCDTKCNDDCGTTILIQGSKFNSGNRTAGAWLADNFYLDPNYNGSFSVSPKIKDFFVDFDYYAGLDQWWCGAYLRVYAPFVHTKWNLEYCEQVSTTSSLGYDIGYFDSIAVPAANLLKSFSEYAAGAAPSFGAGSSVSPQGLNFAKITDCKRTKNGLGDLRAELGWNIWQEECYHLGVNVQGAAPTGTRRRAEFLFDAVVGNGKHWELGGGLTGHYTFWRNEEETSHFGVYLDANLTHLFKAREERTFDLKGKPNSRYMLAAQMGLNTQELSGATPFFVPASNQFTGVYTPVANLTTVDIRVSTGVQADVVAWFNYTRCGWSWDLGYNFYGRSKEQFDCTDLDCNDVCGATSLCDPRQANTWVLKGDERVYGFAGITGPGQNGAIALSASQHEATICKGTNETATACVTNSPDFYKNNCGVNNPQLASLGDALSPLLIAPTGTLVNGVPVTISEPFFVNTSIQPVFINCTDLDYARTKNITNTVFTHISYTWDRECWTPFLGIGGFGEFGSNCNNCKDTCNNTNNDNCTLVNNCDTGNNDCCSGSTVNTSLSRWGVWIKGGVTFN